MPALKSATQYLPDLEQLPLIIAGPMLRHIQADSVTVWLALIKPSTVTLKIYSTEDGRGAILDKLLFQGQRKTVALGKNFHVVAVTAKPDEEEQLSPGQIYAYDLYCDCDQVDLNTAIKAQNNDYSLSYFPHQLPTFALPPKDLNCLNIIHGSCRKPHGGGRDTLSCLDNLIQDSAPIADKRPHQLFLTGDQIYGDDVANPMLWLTQGVNKLLFGWSEELPLQEGTMLADEFPPSKRSAISRIEGGMTAMLSGKSEKAKSHLFSFGEYAAAYLLAWSPVFMPDHLPLGESLLLDRQQAKVWNQEIKDTESFIEDLASVRRALANVPVYTICDDHDVSDDWYLNREWCDRVLGKPLGKRIVQNALLAYAIFQAWGNTPQYFAPGTGGEKLLQLASRWLQSAGQDMSAKIECDRYLGIPENDETTGLPQMQPDEDVVILSRKKETIPWHYTVYGSSHEVIVLDTRTWRGYDPDPDKKLEPPMLLSHHAFEQQLLIPLETQPPHIQATIVVLPTNLVALGIIDHIQQFELSRNRVFSNDVGDSWNFHQEAFTILLLNLCQQRDRVVILSGDIHYSCAVRIVHWDNNSLETTVLVQLTSSAIKNSELATRLIHTKLKSLLPETTERWLGWNQPLKLVKLLQPSWWRTKQSLNNQSPPPDWQYRIEWFKRQPSQSLPWKQTSLKTQKSNPWHKLITQIISWVWRNRWVQEGREVVGRNNLSLVKFRWSRTKTVVQETYWHPPWNDRGTVKSSYEIPLESD
ncbi:alkaline phosphatase D family protein [Pleurocapsa sp. PCC 7319]|uniref:alkaline phosphatase D family protein n=1 Tax=Pleurocapsa sp. PCC 7319 TaxID=118161 RepID=UPI00034780C3|nr:alkaline phosphatase D family protein [Pleurocapsa sp. PCC 7319]